MLHRLVLLALLALPAALAAAQDPAPVRTGPPVITGRVVAAENDAPLRRTRIEVAGTRGRLAAVLTDDAGAFSIEVPATGAFDLVVSRAGRVTAITRTSRDEVPPGMVVRLPRGAAIAGRVVDQHGNPAALAVVAAVRADANVAAGVPRRFSTATDEFGEYRLVGLSPGRYQVGASAAGAAVYVVTTLSAGPTQSLIRTQLPADARLGATVVDGPAASAEPVSTGPVVAVSAGDDAVADIVVTVAERPTPARDLSALKPGFAAGIRGRVTTEQGQPVDGATVRILGAGSFLARTDADGRYVAAGLRPGDYTVEAIHPAFPSIRYGQRGAQDESRAIAVATDVITEGVDLVMPRGATIAGTVFDEHGEPLQGARVRALELRNANGRLVALPTGGWERRTDDRGRYRIAGLLPGTYVVTAAADAALTAPAGQRAATYVPLYYPGTPLIEAAAPLDVTADATGVSFVVAPIRAASLRGTARDGNTFLVAGSARLARSRRSSSIASESYVAAIGAGGTFEFPAVPPGDYVVQVLGDGPGRTGLFGIADVSVGEADPPPLTIATSHGATLEGRLIIEGTPDPATCVSQIVDGATVAVPCPDRTPQAFTVHPFAIDPDRAREGTSGVFVSSGGMFYISGLFGPTGFALSNRPGGDWYLKSLKIGGLEIVDAGFDFAAGPRTYEDAELVLSRNGGIITGAAEQRGAPANDYSVVVFPVDRQQWTPHSRFLKFARARGDGSFRIAGLPPGDYLVAAVDRLSGTAEGGEWQDAGVLAQLAPGAQRTSVAERQTRTLTMRLIRR